MEILLTIMGWACGLCCFSVFIFVGIFFLYGIKGYLSKDDNEATPAED